MGGPKRLGQGSQASSWTEAARRAPRRAGKSVVSSLRWDEGLRAALKARAEAEGITLGEALERATELYPV